MDNTPPSRTTADLIQLFCELGLVGRRALKRGRSLTLEQLRGESKEANEMLGSIAAMLAERLERGEPLLPAPPVTPTSPDPYESITTYERWVEDFRNEFRHEGLFDCADIEGIMALADEADAVPFRDLLQAFVDAGKEHTLHDRTIPLFHLFDDTWIEHIFEEPTSVHLGDYTSKEVLFGLARICALNDRLQRLELPDDRYTDHERELLFRWTTRKERFELWLFFDLIDHPSNLVERHERAEELQLNTPIFPMDNRVAAFLKAAARSYVAGHFPEAVIMCRAMIERSVSRALSRARSGDTEAQDLSLADQIRLLSKAGWLDATLARDANDVRVRANKIVHEDAQIVRDISGTINSALRVVSSLESRLQRS